MATAATETLVFNLYFSALTPLYCSRSLQSIFDKLTPALKPNFTWAKLYWVQNRRARIKKRIRKNISGTATKPRLSVFRSNKQIYAQIIDDLSGNTLASASSLHEENGQKVNKVDQAKEVGKMIAESATKAGIKEVVFDRNGYLFHGRVKALADAARENGLKF